MPFGKYKDFNDCVSKNKNKGDPKAYCASIERKIKGEGLDGVLKENVPIKYMMPIVWESIKQNGRVNEAYVKGVAIAATTSRNNITYNVEELDKSYLTLNGKNIGINHVDDVSNNIGLIENVNFDGRNVNYGAKIFNTSKYPDAVEMVKNKLWQFVSIEAIVSKLVKEENGNYTAKGMTFTGLKFVNTPGIVGATGAISGESFTKAIAEGYNFKIQEEDKMAEEEKTEEVEKPVEEETPEEPKAEEKTDTSKIVSEVLEALEKKEKVKEEANEKMKLEERIKELEKKLEEGAKSEAVVSEETEGQAEDLPGFHIEGLGTGRCSFYVMPDSKGRYITGGEK